MTLKKVRHLSPMKLPKPPTFPDPHLTWLCQIVKEWDGIQRADVAIVGIPFDGGVVDSDRKGTKFGPMSVREALYANTTFNLELDVDLTNLKIVDCGNIDVDNMSFYLSHQHIEAALTPIFESGMVAVIIGGDHSATYPSIKALCNSMKNGKRIGVIDFDAHHDCRVDCKENSGLWVREIQEIDETPIEAKNIVQIGIHGFDYSQFYGDYVKRTGIKFFTPIDVRKKGMETITKEALERASDGTDAIYVSVDIDSIDQAFAPGASYPRSGGLMPWDIIESLIELSKHPLARALDVMEVAPSFDLNNMTSMVAAEIIINFLCGLCLRKEVQH